MNWGESTRKRNVSTYVKTLIYLHFGLFEDVKKVIKSDINLNL